MENDFDIDIEIERILIETAEPLPIVDHRDDKNIITWQNEMQLTSHSSTKMFPTKLKELSYGKPIKLAPNTKGFKGIPRSIQINQMGSFWVQLNSTIKYSKQVNNLQDALWLFEIVVFICIQPITINAILKIGNYDYLLMHNHVNNTTDYRVQLGDNILRLQEKRILEKHEADIAILVFGKLVNDS